MNQPEFACPGCGCTRFQLTITQLIEVQFKSNGDHHVTEQPFGDLEWTDATLAVCGIPCGWSGTLGEADPAAVTHKCRICTWRGTLKEDEDCPRCQSVLVEPIED
jgi:hypothetical protein